MWFIPNIEWANSMLVIDVRGEVHIQPMFVWAP
jgi:hypothetical protein